MVRHKNRFLKNQPESHRFKVSLSPFGLLIYLTAFLVSGCQSNVAVLSTPGTGVVESSPVANLAPPSIVISTSEPPNQPSFKPLEATEQVIINSTTPSVIETAAGDVPQESPSPTILPSATPSPTPMATFTPPAEPAPSGWDHFWLRRPVPEDSVVWTDKTYPYGTTKGGVLRPHHGVEFNIPAGTQVMSTASGTVVMAGNDSDNVVGAFSNFYGNVIVLQLDFLFLGRPVFVVYGHLSEVFVAVGQQVGDYEVLGLSGATGIADGPHLHFEVRVGENSYELTRNPLLWLYPFSDRGAVAGRISWPDGSLAREVPVSLRRVDAPSAYSSTTSYADDSVNSDDNWKENFVLDDVAAGYYVLTVGVGDQKVEVELWVYPYQTSFTEIVLSG